MRQQVCRCKYTKELADAKAGENDALRDDVAAGRLGCTSKQSVSQCVKPPPPAWIMQPPDWQTPRFRIISPSERLIITKQLEGAEVLMSSADRVAHIRKWATHTIIIDNTHARWQDINA